MDFTGTVQTLLQQEPFDEAALQKIRQLAFASDKAMQDFDSFVNQRMEASEARSPGEALRIGLSLCVLSRFEEALPFLEKAQDGREKFLYLGRIQRTLRNYTPARHAFDKAAKAGLPAGVVAVEQARTQIAAGETDAADKILQAVARPTAVPIGTSPMPRSWRPAASVAMRSQATSRPSISTTPTPRRLPPGVPGRPGGR